MAAIAPGGMATAPAAGQAVSTSAEEGGKAPLELEEGARIGSSHGRSGSVQSNAQTFSVGHTERFPAAVRPLAQNGATPYTCN
jgi:hypothetical protein